MKLVIINGKGQSLGEVKLSQELLRRPSILSERIETVIVKGLQSAIDESINDRIVETAGGTLESLDEDTSIMDVPLRLADACKFDFQKHVDAIAGIEELPRRDQGRLYSQENSKKYDARYKERPSNRIKYR